MNKKNFTVSSYINEHINILSKVSIEEVEVALNLINKKFLEGKQIFVCGNGGSALTANHFINDWNKMIYIATKRKFRGISLSDNVGLITSFANDISYDEIYSGQLKNLLNKGDLLIGISGSGNSENIIKAVDFANEQGANTLCLVGYDGGKLLSRCQYQVWIKSFDMQICEDLHFIFGHLVMKKLCSSPIHREFK
jgi:D-sedoheptulose 7-phosphate isomerase